MRLRLGTSVALDLSREGARHAVTSPSHTPRRLFSFLGLAVKDRLQKHGVWEAFEKADAPPGQQLAIRGIISTEHLDLQNEVVVQAGLDTQELAAFGWINNNHSKQPGDEYGQVTRVFPTEFEDAKTGKRVLATGIEGFLADTPDNRRLHANALAFQRAGSPRGYGFSIEGQVLARDPKDRRRILKAKVGQVALTRTPVNPHTRLEALSKALASMAGGEGATDTDAAGSTGTTTGTIAPTVPQDLAGARSNRAMKDYLAKRAKAGDQEARGHLEALAKGGDEEAQRLLDGCGTVAKAITEEEVEDLRKSVHNLYDTLTVDENGLVVVPEEPPVPEGLAKSLDALPPVLRDLVERVDALGEQVQFLNKSVYPTAAATVAIGKMVEKLVANVGAFAKGGDTSALAKSFDQLTGKVEALERSLSLIHI